MEIGEILVNLGFKADYGTLRDFIHNLGDLNIAALIGGGSLGLMVDQIKNIMESANQTALAINNFTGLTGLSSQELQKWDKTAQESGIAAGVMASSINTLQNDIESLTLTGEKGAAYGRLGIDPRNFKDTFDLLKAILTNPNFQNADSPLKKWYLDSLGVNEQMMLLIPNLDKVNNQTTIGDDNLKSMKDFMYQATQLGLELKTLMGDIAALLEKSFVGDMLIGLDMMVKFLENTKLLIPVLLIIAGIMGQIAATSIIAALANPVTAPFAVGAIATGGVLLGASLLGALTRNNDGSSITQHNSIQVSGSDDPQKTAKAIGDYIEKMHSDAEYQSPQYNY